MDRSVKGGAGAAFNPAIAGGVKRLYAIYNIKI